MELAENELTLSQCQPCSQPQLPPENGLPIKSIIYKYNKHYPIIRISPDKAMQEKAGSSLQSKSDSTPQVD